MFPCETLRLADGDPSMLKGRKVGQDEFGRMVRRTISRQISESEIDLLYRIFDTNRDGFLSSAEVIAKETKFRHSSGLKRV